jgi:hypothetical protein
LKFVALTVVIEAACRGGKCLPSMQKTGQLPIFSDGLKNI